MALPRRRDTMRKQVNRVVENINRWERFFVEGVQDRIEATAQRVYDNARARVPRDTGSLAASLAVLLPQRLTARVASLAPYALAVESGYKGRGGPKNRQNRAPFAKVGGRWQAAPDLRAWALRHGIPEEQHFALARSIHREGHRAQPFLFKGLNAELAQLLEDLKVLVPQAAEKANLPQGSARVT
jgi:hypothetical protein